MPKRDKDITLRMGPFFSLYLQALPLSIHWGACVDGKVQALLKEPTFDEGREF